MRELLEALEVVHMPTILLWPNIDAGSDQISKAIRIFRDKTAPDWLRTLTNLPPDHYLQVLMSTACAIGNSSSFVRDASYFGTPVVLVGDRQEGRETDIHVARVSRARWTSRWRSANNCVTAATRPARYMATATSLPASPTRWWPSRLTARNGCTTSTTRRRRKKGPTMQVLGIITARGGSKGIPRKNIASLMGRPLLAYTAEAALAARRLARVVISTDDPEIAQVARACGIEVPFMRPA